MDRMPRESQKTRKDGRRGQAFFYPARIDPMPNRHGCQPLACRSAAASHTSHRAPGLFYFLRTSQSYYNYNEVAFHGIPAGLDPVLDASLSRKPSSSSPRLSPSLSFRGIAVSGSHLPIPYPPTQLDGATAILGLGQ